MGSPDRRRTELEAVIGCWSFSQVMAGRGIPEASQRRARGVLTTTLTFSGTPSRPAMLGGTGAQEGEVGFNVQYMLYCTTVLYVLYCMYYSTVCTVVL